VFIAAQKSEIEKLREMVKDQSLKEQVMVKYVEGVKRESKEN